MVSDNLIIKTKKEKQILDITDKAWDFVSNLNINNGQIFFFISHTTAALTTANLDPGTDLDFLDFLEKIIPHIDFRHPHDPKHAPDHILSSIIGASLIVPVKDGELVLGTWQRIVLVEFNGPRDRTVTISSL